MHYYISFNCIYMNTTMTIKFQPITLKAIPEIIPLLPYANSRTCDFTVAGLLMWADFFKYEYAIIDDTLFVKGLTENDKSIPAFSMPVGKLSPEDSLRILADYCQERGVPLRFSAVPEDRVADFHSLGACAIEELVDWADYLYNASDLASLQGNRYSKKRNHVNRFIADNPGYIFQPLTSQHIPDIKQFYHQMAADTDADTAEEERRQVFQVLDHYDRFPFEGALLTTPDNGIVAFTIGEVIGDTLYVHIEKMNHHINGAGETINKLFAELILDRYGINYINREEDVGDPGLRKAKLSYHPTLLLKKYNLIF